VGQARQGEVVLSLSQAGDAQQGLRRLRTVVDADHPDEAHIQRLLRPVQHGTPALRLALHQGLRHLSEIA
jgi:hypothetical protein